LLFEMLKDLSFVSIILIQKYFIVCMYGCMSIIINKKRKGGAKREKVY